MSGYSKDNGGSTMRTITWALLLVVIIGQGLLSTAIVQTQRAMVTVVYLLQSGTTLEQLEARTASIKAKKDKKESEPTRYATLGSDEIRFNKATNTYTNYAH